MSSRAPPSSYNKDVTTNQLHKQKVNFKPKPQMNSFSKRALLNRIANSKNKKQNGFTLVELMVVIVIVGILSAVALPQLNAAQNRAKDSVAKQEAVSAAKECSIYTLAGGTIPNGSQFIDVTVGANCASVTSTSESTEGTTYTVKLTDGIPGTIEEG